MASRSRDEDNGMMPPPKPYPPLQNGASKNFSPGANKRKNVEPKQSPSGMGKKQKFQNGSSSNGQYASPNSSSEDYDVYDVEDEDDEEEDSDVEDEEEEGFDEEDEEEDDFSEDECCKAQFRHYMTEGEVMDIDEMEDLEECCAETQEQLERLGFRYFRFQKFLRTNGIRMGGDGDGSPPPPPPKQELMPFEKCREILGLPENSTEDEAKRAYLKLARKWHPDKNPNQSEEDAQKFKDILEAFETLTGVRKADPVPGE